MISSETLRNERSHTTKGAVREKSAQDSTRQSGAAVVGITARDQAIP